MPITSDCDQDDVGVARGDGEGQREAGPAGPRRILLRQRQEEQGDGEEQDGRGVLPERLAGGPHRRAEREHRRRRRPPRRRAAPADGQEEHGGGGGGEERRRPLAGERGARLVEGERGQRGEEHRRRQHRREHGIDRDAVRADVRANGVLDLRVLVEVEVAFADEAGRDALRRPGVAGADRPPVGDEEGEAATRPRSAAANGEGPIGSGRTIVLLRELRTPISDPAGGCRWRPRGSAAERAPAALVVRHRALVLGQRSR